MAAERDVFLFVRYFLADPDCLLLDFQSIIKIEMRIDIDCSGELLKILFDLFFILFAVEKKKRKDYNVPGGIMKIKIN